MQYCHQIRQVSLSGGNDILSNIEDSEVAIGIYQSGKLAG